jgi:GGDEF domain-containing protein
LIATEKKQTMSDATPSSNADEQAITQFKARVLLVEEMAGKALYTAKHDGRNRVLFAPTENL